MTRPDLALEAIVALVRATRLRDAAARALLALEEAERGAAAIDRERDRRRSARDPRRFRPGPCEGLA